jgi:hypothetical protein
LHRNWVEIALQELNAEDRALLELSVVREVSDDDIAGLLGVDVGRIEERREYALGRLAELLGETGDDGIEWITHTMRELPTSRWRDEAEPGHHGPPGLPDDLVAPAVPHQGTAETGPVEHEAGSPPAEDESPPEDEGAHRPWTAVRPAFLGALVIVALVALVVSLAGSNDSEDTSSPQSASSPQGSSGHATPLGRVTASGASGSVEVVGSGRGATLHLRVKGLPPPPKGGYVVWLYNSITDARDLGGSLRGTFTLQAPLPGDYRRYRSVDVSREPADGNRNHSGLSVLRAPLPAG